MNGRRLNAKSKNAKQTGKQNQISESKEFICQEKRFKGEWFVIGFRLRLRLLSKVSAIVLEIDYIPYGYDVQSNTSEREGGLYTWL